MTRALIVLLAVASSCVMAHDVPPRPADFSELELGERVPQATVDAAVERVRACVPGCDLDGWRVYVVADSMPCLQGPCFLCPANVRPECGPPPEGYTEETAPCECSGVTSHDSMRIALAPGLASLDHEVTHACSMMSDHDPGGEWCGRR